MKIPFTSDGLVRRTGNGEPAGANRPSQKSQTGLGTFKQILESQIAPAGSAASGSNASEIPDEKTLR
ncbi:MAG: hypothetical protein L7F78_20205, partial [Syntrophales bacterium LBB04]|nr:hypothetical protein [Syntrophales bacterium LBB04]